MGLHEHPRGTRDVVQAHLELRKQGRLATLGSTDLWIEWISMHSPGNRSRCMSLISC